MSPVRPIAGLAAALLALTLGACSYDYLQNTDRVGYHAGDAVKANLAAETLDPSKPSMNKTSGLGQNGDVTSTSASGTPTTY